MEGATLDTVRPLQMLHQRKPSGRGPAMQGTGTGLPLRALMAWALMAVLAIQGIALPMQQAWPAHYHLHRAGLPGAVALGGKHVLRADDVLVVLDLPSAPAGHEDTRRHAHDPGTSGVVYVADDGSDPATATLPGKHDADIVWSLAPAWQLGLATTSDAAIHPSGGIRIPQRRNAAPERPPRA